MKHWWSKVRRFYWRHFASDWQRANHYLRQTDRIYSRLIAEARRKKEGHDKIEELHGEWHAEREPEQDEVDRLMTVYWLRRASRSHLPQPDNSDTRCWKRDEYRGVSRLTDSGIDFIDRALYEKRKRRWEIWSSQFTALTGLIGALTGLAAIFFYHSK